MPRMKALKTFRLHDRSVVAPGEEYDVTQAIADQHEKAGKGVPAGGAAARSRTKRAANKAAAAGPLRSPGGRTGAARAASSSRPARAPARKKTASHK